MDTYESRHDPASTEREFQVLRTLVASSGLLPFNRLNAQDRYLTLPAEADWDRQTHQAGARLSAIPTRLTRSRRWLASALIRTGRRLEGAPGADASHDLALGHDSATS